jgi:hypothetical protein
MGRNSQEPAGRAGIAWPRKGVPAAGARGGPGVARNLNWGPIRAREVDDTHTHNLIEATILLNALNISLSKMFRDGPALRFTVGSVLLQNSAR